MKKKYISLYAYMLTPLMFSLFTYCIDPYTPSAAQQNEQMGHGTLDFERNESSLSNIDRAGAPAIVSNSLKKAKKDTTKIINFRYNNENLVDIINFLAAQKECNILLPQGADAITNTVTLSIDEKISVGQAWELLNIMLNIAGYSMFPKEDMFIIKKNAADTTPRELGKLYIGTKPEELPNSEEQIQYIYFLANAKAFDDANNDLNNLLNKLLPKEAYKVDQSTNGIIFSAKANLIKSIMKIVVELDKAGFAEKLAVIRLHHASAELIAELFTKNIIKTAEGFERYRVDTKKQSDPSYFSKSVKIIPEPRTNSLIVLGKAQAVERVQDFIYKYIDVELESGKSILHIYPLQYLEADKAQDAVQRVIDAAKNSGTGQAKGAPLNPQGTQRTFGDVIIQTDKAIVEQGRSGDASDAAFGGNKLIVAARYDDWRVIKELLDKLDQPQPQVIIEVIIADLTLDDVKELGASLRNPAKIPLPGDVQFQAGTAPNDYGIVLDPSQEKPKSINADLLANNFPVDKPSYSQADVTSGAMVFSLNDNDGRTWCFAQLLKNISKTKILSAPHVIATNNQEALVKIGEARNLPDESVGTSGSTTIKYKYVAANLEVKLTPRISSEAESVTMKISIDITQYNNNSTATRTTRNVVTNATIHDKDILAIGGLIRTDAKDSIKKTPILGDVPILGWFFKGRNSEATKTNLTVFIQPTIIRPYLRSGVSPETQKYVNFATASSQQGELFDSVKDPVTRIFFNSSKFGTEDTDTEINKFIEKNQTKDIEPLVIAQDTHTKKQKQPQIEEITVATAQAPSAHEAENKKLAVAYTPSSENKIRELVKNEPNPLRRVQS